MIWSTAELSKNIPRIPNPYKNKPEYIYVAIPTGIKEKLADMRLKEEQLGITDDWYED